MMRPGVFPVGSALPPDLDRRSATILREVVEEYMANGEPVGSRTLARRLSQPLSPATVRNIMASLTEAGLLFSPHTSAGRLPTEAGLRLFVDGLLQFGALSEEEQTRISHTLEARGRSLQDTMTEASSLLSGMSDAAGLVIAPKSEGAVKHIEFVALGGNRALVVLVGTDGRVENRVTEIPAGVPASALVEAANYLNARLKGVTLSELCERVSTEISDNRHVLDELTADVVERGLAIWGGDTGERGGTLIVRGQSRLLTDVAGQERLQAIQTLFDRLEAQETMLSLLELAESSEGVRIFIGAESGLFGASGMSMVVAPARNETNRIVGAIGVIGPKRINYGRIIPVVDYTARFLGEMLG